MKVLKITQIILIGLLLTNCSSTKQYSSPNKEISENLQPNYKNSKWVETMGTIIESSETPDGNFAYTISYEIIPFVNMDGELNNGPLIQHIFGLDKKVIEGQKLKLHYLKKEPICYELLEDIKFVK